MENELRIPRLTTRHRASLGRLATRAGAYNSCVVLTGGTVACWSFHSAGQMSLGQTSSSNVPVTIAKLSNVSELSRNIDSSYTCAVLNSSSVACWSNLDTTPTLITTTTTTSRSTSSLRRR